MNDITLSEKIDNLTSAFLLLAKLTGTRLSRADMCERLGVCGKTLTERVRADLLPAPSFDGKWLLWRVLEWDIEQINRIPPVEMELEPVDDGATDEPGFHLYRHFDAAGQLLYVGVSINALTRLAAHRQSAHWFWRIAKVEVTNWKTREASLAAERRAIRDEGPLFNIVHALRRAA